MLIFFYMPIRDFLEWFDILEKQNVGQRKEESSIRFVLCLSSSSEKQRGQDMEPAKSSNNMYMHNSFFFYLHQT